MKNIAKTASRAALAAALLAAAGCGKDAKGPYIDPEAVAFGYRNSDTEGTNTNFVVSAGDVTNWVPERVVSVFEKYEFTQDELAAVRAADALMPGETYPSFPEGYERDGEEPWFAWWVKKASAFGFEGKAGILAHFDEDAGAWQTGESYFSSYWPTREEALAALETVKAKFAGELAAKKIYSFDGLFIAEYRRLCITCATGPKADGTWSCMVDIRDKCRAGCGQWAPEEEQLERVAARERAKAERARREAEKAWRAECAKVVEANSAAVAKEMEARSLAGFPGAAQIDAGGPDAGRKSRCVRGNCPAVNDPAKIDETLGAEWARRMDEVEKALGTRFDGEIAKTSVEGGVWWSARWHGDLFDVRMDLAAPVAPPAAEGGEEKPAEEISGVWNLVYTEVLLDGAALPERPAAAGPAK